jgi:hypothetical protein
LIPDIGCELPVFSDLLPQHDILTGNFLWRRTLVFKLKVPISRAAEDPNGFTFRVVT